MMTMKSARVMGFLAAALMLALSPAKATTIPFSYSLPITTASGDISATELVITGVIPGVYQEQLTLNPAYALSGESVTVTWATSNGGSAIPALTSTLTGSAIQPVTTFPSLSLATYFINILWSGMPTGGLANTFTLTVTPLIGRTDGGSTPLPGALVLFGTVLAGAGAFMRRRRDKGSALPLVA